MEVIKLWEHLEGEREDCPVIEEYAIKDGKRHSCIIVCPGGGYNHVSGGHEGEKIAKKFHELGISAFSLHYRLYPYLHPTPMNDLKRAIKWVIHNADKYNINPDKIGLIGFSAGAHLACSALENLDNFNDKPIDEIDKVKIKITSLALCYPVISLSKQISHKGSRQHLVGDNMDMARQLSCEMNVKEDMPPTFIWHTLEDQSVNPLNSIEMAKALKKANVPYELHIFENGLHGLDLAEEVEGTRQWFDLYHSWLSRLGFC